MILIAVILFWLGLCAGSFVNALVWRIHEQTRTKKPNKKLSVINGRSMCVHCKHVLAWYDLIPVFSWVLLKGKCRFCKKPISRQYPIVELIGGLVFALSYIFWPQTLGTNGQWLLLATWLVSSVGLLALAAYDLKWMLLPNRIIYPTLIVAAVGRLGYIVFFSEHKAHSLLLLALSLLVASGIFFLLFTVSKGKWIGYGDVRLGLITGTLLATPTQSLAMIFLASLLGSLTVLPSLFNGSKNLSSRLPYGPFLIIATAIMVVFGGRLLDWYENLIF